MAREEFSITRDEFFKIVDSIMPDVRGCKIWPGINRKYFISVRVENRKVYRTARLVLERKLGRPVDPNLMACHTCDVPRCVNEEHLYEGTAKQNWQDCLDRHPRFKKNRE